jgi:hypothetical protein
MRVMKIGRLGACCCILSGAALLFGEQPAAAQNLDSAIGMRGEANQEGVNSQARIDKLADQTDQIVSEYRNTIDQVESLRVYNRQMEALVAAQQTEMDSLRGQIDDIALVGRGVMPLMLEMLDTLEAFVALDLPFLAQERAARVEDLREMMDRPDVTDAEKYRRLMEAYQIEGEYGRTVEAYRDTLADGRIVDFLRLGRIALLYQTPDGEETAAWDREQKTFVVVDGSYRSAVKDGLKIARKQSRPDLIRVPLPVATSARGPR